MQGITLTVSQLNEYVRRSLSGDPMLRSINLRGEISNFKAYASGHWYFTLKDDESRIDCALFRQYTFGVRFQPRDGMRVVVSGAAGLYVQAGKYQFYAESMREDGVGELYLRYLALKERLEAEGLFDSARKRPLPLKPRKVGIVTSPSGAVLHDIRTVAGRRFPGLPLVLCPVQVQGEGAAADIARALARLARVTGVDVIICGRGGGSMEDLWAFNEEIAVRAVAKCPVPVISAVGHETDVTLCDFAADMRAATPSAAAELAVPERSALVHSVQALTDDLARALGGAIHEKRAAVSALSGRLALCHPAARLTHARMRAEALTARLQAAGEKQTALLRARVEALGGKLRAIGPKQALERGYVIALGDDSAPITDISGAVGDITLLFRNGRALARVIETERGEPFGI